MQVKKISISCVQKNKNKFMSACDDMNDVVGLDNAHLDNQASDTERQTIVLHSAPDPQTGQRTSFVTDLTSALTLSGFVREALDPNLYETKENYEKGIYTTVMAEYLGYCVEFINASNGNKPRVPDHHESLPSDDLTNLTEPWAAEFVERFCNAPGRLKAHVYGLITASIHMFIESLEILLCSKVALWLRSAQMGGQMREILKAWSRASVGLDTECPTILEGAPEWFCEPVILGTKSNVFKEIHEMHQENMQLFAEMNNDVISSESVNGTDHSE